MRRLLLGVVLVLVLGAQTQSPSQSSFEEGLLAYHRGDHAAALEIWRSIAKKGHPAAQFQIGLLYHRGEGVLPNLKQAAHWYRKAADRGDADAQLNLGLLYAQGEGVKRSYVSAYKWFSLAYLHYELVAGRDAAYKNRENVAVLMTPEQIARADHLIKVWKPKKR